jgi:hypothetical protein
MDAPTEPLGTHIAYSRSAIVSFILGLVTMFFPIISIYYLFAANGGPGYVQSLFCGIPLAFASVIIGMVSLVQTKRKNQKGAWMAILGSLLGILVLGISVIMLGNLIIPFLMGSAG